MPFSRQSASAAGRSGPSPIMTSVAGTRCLQAVEDLDDVQNAFHRPEVRDVQEHLPARGHEPARELRRFRRPALGVDEVRHDLDLLLRLEDLDRDFLEVLGDGGDDVGLLDAETRDRKVRAVLPDDRHVRPVQRRHEAEAPRGEHLAREVGRDRVRKRVVDVDEVEPLVRRDVAHARREREVVGRVLEERVRRDRDLVVRHAVERRRSGATASRT